ncbi:MAG: transglycosylase domain-containing protein [Pseudomonadota bacterium]|mgnify:CR=1 FL=1
MSNNDPFDLPEGYGGVGSSVPRKTIEELEAEVRAIRSSPAAASERASIAGTASAFARRVSDGFKPAAPIAQEGGQSGGAPPSTSVPTPSKWRRRWTWAKRGSAVFAILFTLTVAWLAWTAPLSKSLEPIAPPQLTLVSAEGRPIARNGAIVDEPVEVAKLPPHVIEAFLATEDRRFYSHWGVDPIGIARAAWNNLTSDSTAGGSTITQQLAKFTFLSSDQTYSRKARELLIAWWMEAWLTKDEILSRYLSNAYFGDNVYGLRAASLHYFYRQPEHLTLSQATMLAGLVKAPSRLAPTRNLRGAQARQQVVIAGMVDADYLTAAEAARIRPASIDHRARSTLPTGTYFADWAMPQARATIQAGYGEARVTTTLNARLQDIARRVTARAGIGRAQVALVAMRPNGEVVAMIGGRSYADSPFNRATQALRQPGSTFKLVVYLAALRAGMTPETMVEDSPIAEGDYRPTNYSARYRGRITLREAFAQSSNVVAVRIYNQVGGEAVRQAARDLGITSPIADNASSALGSSGTTLIQLTAAFATISGNYGPITPHALRQEEPGLIESLFDGRSSMPSSHRAAMLDLLSAVIDDGRGGGTGRAARLGVPAFGKTGTTQDYRDALFVGFAGDLVVGVWIGNDDNSPLHGMTGGSEPARIWRAFMAEAIPGAAPRPRRPAPPPRPDAAIFDDLPVISEPEITIDPENGVAVDAQIGPVGVTIDRNGVTVQPGNRDTAIQKER